MGVISLEEITRFGVSMESKLLYQFDELIKKKITTTGLKLYEI